MQVLCKVQIYSLFRDKLKKKMEKGKGVNPIQLCI